MNVCVYGLWHLGSVTAACLASAGHQVTGVDTDPEIVAQLARGVPPLFEPGLAALVGEGLAAERLRFTADVASAVAGAEVVWITCDTPVDEQDRADVDAVVQQATALLPHLSDGALVLVSSQLPVGTVARLERACAAVSAARLVGFACSPENLRLGHAVEAFTNPDRVVVGTRSEQDRAVVAELLRPFTTRVEWMTVESAEMTKHALNAFLATSVSFINEVASLCEQVGAAASEVRRGLQTDARIGLRAYLSPGAAFAGGTLARDVTFLAELGAQHGVPTHLLSAVKTSNDAHGGWARRRLAESLGGLAARTIAVWGLTYKPGTDTLRRSSAIELCRWLAAQGARVQAHDPSIQRLPPDMSGAFHLAGDPLDAIAGADALVVATPWPDYRRIEAGALAGRMSGNLVLDAGGYLVATLGQDESLKYVRVGQPVT